MSETIKDVTPDSTMSFYDKAARYSVVTPFITAGIEFVALFVLEHLSLSEGTFHRIVQAVMLCALCIQLSSFILGLASCCGFRHHTRKLTIWIAVLGILASCGLGFLTLFLLATTLMGP